MKNKITEINGKKVSIDRDDIEAIMKVTEGSDVIKATYKGVSREGSLNFHRDLHEHIDYIGTYYWKYSFKCKRQFFEPDGHYLNVEIKRRNRIFNIEFDWSESRDILQANYQGIRLKFMYKSKADMCYTIEDVLYMVDKLTLFVS